MEAEYEVDEDGNPLNAKDKVSSIIEDKPKSKSSKDE
jgi:hypothetical protein